MIMLSFLLKLPLWMKRLIVVIVDVINCALSTWFSLFLISDGTIEVHFISGILAILSVLCFVPIFSLMGLYRRVFRYQNLEILKLTFIAHLTYGAVFFALVLVISHNYNQIPASFGALQPIILFEVSIVAKSLMVFLADRRISPRQLKKSGPEALIYGAGVAGQQLEKALRQSSLAKVVGFLDDSNHLQGRLLNGKPVFAPSQLANVINETRVTHVFLAIPSATVDQRKKAIANLIEFELTIRSVPSIDDLVNGRVNVADIRDLSVDDLIGRTPVDVDHEALATRVVGKVILVTGAGGSIGSELCRQIVRLNPRTLVLVDINEFGLYQTLEQLKNIQHNYRIETDIIPALCSVQNRSQIGKVCSAYRPDIVYHAAAYKHVALVEQNIIEAIKNNVFGTQVIVEASMNAGVSEFALVSTDKAVRPSNVMGATKRLAEIIVQSNRNSQMRISIVRFGNVIESSGSVIPKFRRQIAVGGPLTVTHPEVTRFFMTIKEAAQLIMLSGALEVQCGVFVLEMGEPVKIVDVAKKMIALAGLSERTETQPQGEIEIKYIGLFPGEKLDEELLIEGNLLKTRYSSIMMVDDSVDSHLDLQAKLNNLKKLVSEHQIESVLLELQALIPDLKFSHDCIDPMFEKTTAVGFEVKDNQ